MIKFVRLCFYLIVITLTFASCNNEEIKETEVPHFTFVAAGHVYGHPSRYTSSVYPNFLTQLKKDLDTNKVNALFLTGDVVAHPTPENWNTVKSELDSLAIPEWYIAPGNHDVSAYMDQYIQDKKYFALWRNENLFLVLNTSFAGWTVDSTQNVFVRKALEEYSTAQNVFVFTHQLWWLNEHDAKYELDTIIPNSYAMAEGEHTFWDDLFPAFEQLKQPVYFIAGDIGCFEGMESYYADNYKNFHFYGSGMGGAQHDNYLKVNIFTDSVQIVRCDF
jgi:hypothetical protein